MPPVHQNDKTKPRMLTITPTGGLCNRLAALHSAIELSLATGKKLRVIWLVDRNLGCPFDHLFEIPNEVDTIVTRWHLRRPGDGRLRAAVRRATQAWPPLRPDLRPEQIQAMMREGFDFTRLAGRRHTHIRSWSLFFPGAGSFERYRPVAPLQRRIDAVVADFNNTVGVHIRRADHDRSIKHSPTDLFIDRMGQILSADPSTSFFVATDDPLEESRLREAFSGRILSTRKASLDRSEAAAIEAAVVDLYALAATKAIVGSFASTFSRTAGLLGRRDVEYVSEGELPDLIW